MRAQGLQSYGSGFAEVESKLHGAGKSPHLLLTHEPPRKIHPSDAIHARQGINALSHKARWIDPARLRSTDEVSHEVRRWPRGARRNPACRDMRGAELNERGYSRLEMALSISS